MRFSPLPIAPFWRSFSVERSTQTQTTAAWLANNLISATFSAPWTTYGLVEFICASATRPIRIASISEKLQTNPVLRGRVCFGIVGNVIDEIAFGHDDMEWWVGKKTPLTLAHFGFDKDGKIILADEF